MPLTEPQQQVATSDSRFRLLVAGRRFGKTYLCRRELAYFARIPNRTCWYVAPSYRMAKQILWRPLKEKLMDLNWIEHKDESDLRIDLVNGSTIALRGADNPDSLRGNRLDFCIFDETADIHSDTWYSVIRPALADSQGHALFTGTPKGTGNWFYDLYRTNQNSEDWGIFSYTTLEGGNVTAEEVASARATMDERTFAQEFEASFETWTGIVVYNWDRVYEQAYTGSVDSLILGVDFNIDPMTCVVYVQTEHGLWAIDEVVMMGSNTEELVQELHNRYPKSRMTAYPDPAGVQRKTSASGRTDMQILQNGGIRCVYRRQHPPVRDRINSINSLMKNTEGANRYLVDPGCKRLMESYEKLTYKEGTSVVDKTSGYDHMFDAATYPVEYLFPITSTRTPPPQPERWTMAVAG